jgi:uncharacterized DUF497 family protein
MKLVIHENLELIIGYYSTFYKEWENNKAKINSEPSEYSVALHFIVYRYLSTDSAVTKWGVFSRVEARDVVIGYSLLTILFGWISIQEAIKHFKNKKEM